MSDPDSGNSPKQTSMEQLDEAVKRHAHERFGVDGAMVSGWVLMIAGVRLYDDGEPVYQWCYSCGPGTDVVRAVGIAELGLRDMYDDLSPHGTEQA